MVDQQGLEDHLEEERVELQNNMMIKRSQGRMHKYHSEAEIK